MEREAANFQEISGYDLSHIPEPADYNQVLLKLLSSPNISSKQWTYQQQYNDSMAGPNTAAVPGAPVLRLKEISPRGLVLTTCSNRRCCDLEPYQGGALAIAEAARELVCTGAEPLGTQCVHLGNPGNSEIFWQIQQIIQGMGVASRGLGIPTIGAQVRLYHETRDHSTPIVGMVGLLDNVERHCSRSFKAEGDIVLLLGPLSDEIGGSEYLSVVHGLEAGPVPRLDLGLERKVQQVCQALIQQGLVQSAYNCSEGGLAVALGECCISGKIGVEIGIDPRQMLLQNGTTFQNQSTPREPFSPEIELDKEAWQRLASPLESSPCPCDRGDVMFFGEGPSRIVLSIKPERIEIVQKIAQKERIPLWIIGVVGGERLKIWGPNTNPIDLSVAEITRVWEEEIPRCLSQK